MFENNLETKLKPYLKNEFGFDPNLLTDLSRRRFFQRDKILKYLERYNFDRFQLQDYLSITYEKILDLDSKRQQNFLKAFDKDLTKFSRDRAVISFILHTYFENEKEVEEILSKLEELKIGKNSNEAFDLVSRYIESIFLNGYADSSSKNAKKALQSVKALAGFLEVELKNFSSFFEEIAETFEENIHINAAKVVLNFAKSL